MYVSWLEKKNIPIPIRIELASEYRDMISWFPAKLNRLANKLLLLDYWTHRQYRQRRAAACCRRFLSVVWTPAQPLFSSNTTKTQFLQNTGRCSSVLQVASRIRLLIRNKISGFGSGSLVYTENCRSKVQVSHYSWCRKTFGLLKP